MSAKIKNIQNLGNFQICGLCVLMIRTDAQTRLDITFKGLFISHGILIAYYVILSYDYCFVFCKG